MNYTIFTLPLVVGIAFVFMILRSELR